MPLTSAAIKARAREVGFDLVGIARAARHPRLARLASWIDEGRAGEMSWLAASLDERLDPTVALPGARSVVSLGLLYNTAEPYSSAVEAADRTAISRYAWGRDYHDLIRERLTPLVRWMAETAGPGLEAWSSVDTGPVQERVFAEQAGLGWIGKNTCLINPEIGSWVFLAEIVTSADLEPDAPGVDQCGACTRCLEACPTGAIVEPYTVDATRCLSYLTIERKSEPGPEWHEAIGRHVFGCDVCQDVCPWNRRAPVSGAPDFAPREGLAYPRLIDLCRLTDDAWRALMRDSALRRAGLRRLRRSLACAVAALEPRDQRVAAVEALAAHPSAADPAIARLLDDARRRT
ncbi:MAG: tRNA epoxyqueuosine(34) reductase QueG [Vicinamibacterales bacterium]